MVTTRQRSAERVTKPARNERTEKRKHRPLLTSGQVFNALMTVHKQSGPPWWLQNRGGTANLDQPGRDLDTECGYIQHPTREQYLQLHSRVAVANRAINIWPDECWAVYPELYQTESVRVTAFERAWEELNKKCLCWHFLHRIDRLSGIGKFGLLFMGISDGRSLDQPVRGIDPKTGEQLPGWKPLQLLYLRAFDESSLQVGKLESDPLSPRFGQPVYYNVNFYDPNGPGVSSDAAAEGNFQSWQVHWTRVIHVADNRMSSEVFGTPRLEPILNNVTDIRKVLGSSAEMFYKGGFPGYMFQTDPNLGVELDLDEDSIKDTVEAYMNGLQRYMTAVGGRWESLAPQVADPTAHLIQQLNILCATLGVPTRIFLGSEAGHLASTQDADTWKVRLHGRQIVYLEPMLIRPFVDRCILIGALPKVSKYVVSWHDLQTLGEKDRADVALKKSQAIMQYIAAGGNQLVPIEMFLTLILGMTDMEAATAVAGIKATPKSKILSSPSGKQAQGGGKAGGNPAGGGRVGNPPNAKTGSPGTQAA